MLANLSIALGIIYLVFGAVVASIYVLFDSGTRYGGSTLMDPVRWFGITVGWFPAIVYFVGKFAWDIFGFKLGLHK